MKKVRAKFMCLKKTETTDGYEVEMVPVTGSSDENEEFFKYTPFGELKMGTINKDAADLFSPNKEYYLDFTLAD